MKVCVTGASGFIGRYVVERLAADGHEVSMLDLYEPDFDPPPRCTFLRGDIRDPEAMRRAVAGCDALFNLAAAHHDFGIDEPTYYAVNEEGSRVVCRACDEAGITDVVFYSTVAVFGDAPEPHREDSPKEPNNHYGGSKLKGEAVFEQWVKQGGGRRCLVVRPTITFGPRNFANMYSLIRQIEGGKYLNVGDGLNIKSLSYVENLVDLTMFAWGRKGSHPPFEIVNYIDKPDFTSHQIAEVIFRALGKHPPRYKAPLWLAVLVVGLPFDLLIRLTGKNYPISSMRLRKMCTQTKFEADKVRAMGYVPLCSLEEGIDRMVRWYLSQGRSQIPVWRTPPRDVQRLAAPARIPAPVG